MHHHELEPNVVDVTKNVTRKSFIFDHLNSDIKEIIANISFFIQGWKNEEKFKLYILLFFTHKSR